MRSRSSSSRPLTARSCSAEQHKPALTAWVGRQQDPDRARPGRARKGCAMARSGLLTVEELRGEVEAGRIDTVLLAMADMQGRLQGKRLAATHFLDDVLEHNAEGCNYLLAVDVDMNTVSGYAMSSWDLGYGDFEMRPDMDTLREVPWHE